MPGRASGRASTRSAGLAGRPRVCASCDSRGRAAGWSPWRRSSRTRSSQCPASTRRGQRGPCLRPPRPAASPMAPAVDRRARLVLRRLDPWSVLKFSVVFYFCLMLISLLVFAVIWFVLVNMGVFTSLTDFAGNFNLEVAFPAGTVFRWYTFIGLLGVVVWSIVTVLLTLLFNLVNDVTGGIEVVLAEREQRPVGS